MSAPASPRPAAIAWDWPQLLLGLAFAVPTLVVTPFNATFGLALAVGILPVAAVGLPAARRGRVQLLAVAVLAAICLLVGSLLGQIAVLAVLSIFALSLGASVAASRIRLGALALSFAVPLIGIGFSLTDIPTVLGISGLIVASGCYAVAVSLLWPEKPETPKLPQPPPSRAAAVDFGIRLGLAAATAATLGFAFHVDHKGWMCGAVLFVMRPSNDALAARSVGRAASVFIGGLVASAFILTSPSPLVLGLVLAVVLAVMSATQPSRWYVAPAFSTFIVFALLLYDHPTETAWRFAQRNLETVVGVGLALVFGLLVPLLQRRFGHRPAPVPATRTVDTNDHH